MIKNKNMFNCKFREKQILCGACCRSSCKYPKESPDIWNPQHEGECWRYECSINRSICNGDCSSKVNKRIEDLEKDNRDYANSIQRNKSEILKLKMEFE